MVYDPSKHHRHSIRLDYYDYRSEGAYFITIVTYQRQPLFGSVGDGSVELNTLGCIVETEWRKTEKIRPYVILDNYIVMPNHLHAIFFINYEYMSESVRADRRSAPTKRQFGKAVPQSVSSIMRQFKSIVTKQINKTMATPSMKRWQRNYYERVIRNEQELNAIRLYIQHNPAMWLDDDLYVTSDAI